MEEVMQELGTAEIKFANDLKEMLTKCVELENDRNVIGDFWLSMRQKNISELDLMGESQDNVKLSNLMKVVTFGGLTLASGALAFSLTPSTAGLTLGIAGIAAVSFGAGCSSEKVNQDKRHLEIIQSLLQSDLLETNEFLDTIGQEIKLLNKIQDILSERKISSAMESENEDSCSFDSLFENIDSCITMGVLSTDCLRKISSVCANKLRLLASLQAVLKDSTIVLEVSDSEQAQITSKKPWYQFADLSYRHSGNSMETRGIDIDYVIEQNEDSDGFLHIQKPNSKVNEAQNQNSANIRKKLDFQSWLKEKTECLNGSMINAQNLLNFL